MISSLLQFAAEETTQKSGIAVLGINPLGLLLQLITFLIIFLLLKKFAFETIVKQLEKRRETINDGIKLGHKMEAEYAELEAKVKTQLHQARLEADKIMAAAQREAGEIEKAAEAAAQRKVTALLDDAQAKINSATAEAKRQLLQEARSLVADATALLIEQKIDAQKDAALLNHALEEVNK